MSHIIIIKIISDGYFWIFSATFHTVKQWRMSLPIWHLVKLAKLVQYLIVIPLDFFFVIGKIVQEQIVKFVSHSNLILTKEGELEDLPQAHLETTWKCSLNVHFNMPLTMQTLNSSTLCCRPNSKWCSMIKWCAEW